MLSKVSWLHVKQTQTPYHSSQGSAIADIANLSIFITCPSLPWSQTVATPDFVSSLSSTLDPQAKYFLSLEHSSVGIHVLGFKSFMPQLRWYLENHSGLQIWIIHFSPILEGSMFPKWVPSESKNSPMNTAKKEHLCKEVSSDLKSKLLSVCKEDEVHTQCNIMPPKNEWNNAICSNVDGPRNYHTKWNKSDKERQISYDITYMWNLKKWNKWTHL